MWVITKSYNEYNQYGDYLVACFSKKPTFEIFLKTYLNSEGLRENYFDECEGIEVVEHYYKNKGRFNIEDSWYFLSEIKDGELYKEQYSKN